VRLDANFRVYGRQSGLHTSNFSFFLLLPQPKAMSSIGTLYTVDHFTPGLRVSFGFGLSSSLVARA
jgi:hypothetical protein